MKTLYKLSNIKRIALLIFVFLTINLQGQDGKLVFSKTPSNEKSSPATTFDPGEKIYCSVILEKPLSEYETYYEHNDKKTGRQASGYRVRAYIDDFKGYDKDQGTIFSLNSMTAYKYPDQAENIKSGKKIDFLLNEKENNYYGINVEFNEALNKLTNGPHQIRIVFWGYSGSGERTKKLIAYSDFTFNKSENGKVKLGKSFSDFTAKMKDPTLEAAALKYFQNDFDPENTKGQTYLKTKILDSDWTINRHPSSGVITGRTIEFAVLIKKKSGDCEVQQWYLEQSYTGSGYQNTLRLGAYRTGDYIHKVECE